MASLMRALGSKVSDFYVKLEDPHRIFVPGDVVKGSPGTVHVLTTRPSSIEPIGPGTGAPATAPRDGPHAPEYRQQGEAYPAQVAS